MEGKCLGDIQHFLLDSERINWDYMHASARAGFIRGGANWAVAQGPPPKTLQKLLPKET